MNDALDRIAAVLPVVRTVVVVAAAVLTVVLVVRVVRKAGYSPWWAIGVFVPGVNLVLLVMFASVRWPLERRLDEAERRLAHAPHLGGTTPNGALASMSPPAGVGLPTSAGVPAPAVAPPTFTPLPYPAGYGSPPSPVSDVGRGPADTRPDAGA